MQWAKQKSGFTIVELLIVVVVIAILAAITIVAYNGIQNRANDSAVQADMQQIAKKLEMYYAENGSYPTSEAHMTSMNLSATKQAYGRHVASGTARYNLLYCRPHAPNMNRIALIASSNGGTLFRYVDGSFTSIPRTTWDSASPPSATLCSEAGVNASTPQLWMYSNNAWVSWVAG